MSKAAARVALLLVRVVAVSRHVSRLPAVVAQLLSLLLGLLAVSGDVASSATVIAGCRGTPGSVSAPPARSTSSHELHFINTVSLRTGTTWFGSRDPNCAGSLGSILGPEISGF